MSLTDDVKSPGAGTGRGPGWRRARRAAGADSPLKVYAWLTTFYIDLPEIIVYDIDITGAQHPWQVLTRD